jgi:hypothetical protein
MDFSDAYKHASAAGLHFSPSGALVAHAVGPRLVVRDADSLAIARVWDLADAAAKPWKVVDAIEWSPEGLLLAACLEGGEVRVVCPDPDLESVLLDGVYAPKEGWECRIEHGEGIAAVKWGPGAGQVWVWEDLNVTCAFAPTLDLLSDTRQPRCSSSSEWWSTRSRPSIRHSSPTSSTSPSAASPSTRTSDPRPPPRAPRLQGLDRHLFRRRNG